MSDFIYGELNDAVLSIDYEGKCTDTADVSVDPTKRTVSVDVRKVPCALSVQTQSGLVSYDGSRPVSLSVGAYELREVGSTGNFRNYGLFQSGSDGALGVTIGVPSAKTLLSAEIMQCQVADEPVLGYKVGEYYARLTCASRDSEAQDNYYVYMLLSPILQGVGDLVDSEKERAEEAEQALSEAISDEASAREAGDSANSGLVAAERERAEGKEGELESAIQAEAQRAKGKEAEIESALSSETETRQSEDSAIRASVSSEISRASQAEGTLQSKLDAESKAREEADARYAQKTAEVLSSGALTSISYSQIEPYAFVVVHGYKNNVGAPNQLTFVLVPKWLTDGESNLIVPGMAIATNWNYGIVFTRKGDTVSWETDVDYGGDRQFLATNILGVY